METNIIIFNHEINSFASYLLGFELKGKETRMRTRFVKVLTSKLQQIEEERIILIKEYAHLDEEANPVRITDEEGNSVYDMKDANGFAVEYTKLQNEELIIIQDESNADMLRTIKSIILNDERSYSGLLAFQFDRWCEIIEQVSD